MKRFLVTGAQGFVGRYLVAELLEANSDALVVGLGRSAPCPSAFSYGIPLPPELSRRLSAAEGRYRYLPIPVEESGELKALVQQFAPECVFHLASALHTAAPRDLIRTNAEGTLALLNALEGGDALLVHGSSGSVYGEPLTLPMSEGHSCAPTTLYGLTKRTAEQVLQIMSASAGLQHVVARIFNIVGPGQTADHVCGRFARDLFALRRGEDVLPVGPLNATRDFIDVRDVATGLWTLAHEGEPGRAYNVASGVEVSIREMLGLLVQASGIEARIVESRQRDPGVSRNVADVTKLKQLGWMRRFSLEQSLRDLVEFERQLRAGVLSNDDRTPPSAQLARTAY